MTDSQSKAPAKKKNTAVAPTYDYGSDAGTGFEDTTGAELSIPFINILQSNSPQVEDESPEGSEPGMFFNTVTHELVNGKDGIVFLPVQKTKKFVEWVPRNKGGGLVAIYNPEDEIVQKALAGNDNSSIGLKNGENDLTETYYVYGLVLDPTGQESVGFGVLSFTSTKIKQYRDWMTAMYMLKGKPPLFANRAVLKTQKQKNEKGTYFNFLIEPLKGSWKESLIDPQTESDLLSEAKDFLDMVNTGRAQADHESQASTVGETSEDDHSAF